MRWMWQWLFAGLVVICLASVGAATVIHIPLEYETIQNGINAADEGDTVLVADGTYTGSGNRDLDFGGVNMVVMSENGPEVTIIDCQASWSDLHRGFYFHSGEDSTSKVQGFTVKNGYVSGSQPYEHTGGAIFCLGSSPTIEGNIIAQSTAVGGGGIGCWDSSPTIVDNTICGNTATYGGGGIRCVEWSFASIMGNTIIANTAARDGGGIVCYYDDFTTIVDNVIALNAAGEYGGGISCRDFGGADIECNMIIGNTAWRGGGISYVFASPRITGNMIMANVTSHDGGGVYCEGQEQTYTGNAIVGNICGSNGGGIYSEGSNLWLDGNTIAYNEASAQGGGISCDWSSHHCVINSILWGNRALTDLQVHVSSSSSMDITFCDVMGEWPGWGNIHEEPMFVSAQKRDYRLLWGSPCIDAGHPDSLDPDGTRSDMGAFFFDQDDYLTLYVTPDTMAVAPGGQLGVTYTLINRWVQPEPFWVLTEAILPNGNPLNVFGPDRYVLPAHFTAQQHLNHSVPTDAPPGVYQYQSRIGMPPSTLYDEDSFRFVVLEGLENWSDGSRRD